MKSRKADSEVEVLEQPTQARASTPISVRPFIEDINNMGLENYNMVVFPGVVHEEDLSCIDKNGVVRYITGLNEFAPEVKNIQDASLRKAIIKEIRETVSQLEMELASNIIDPADPEFWNKVKILKPDNSEFWSKIVIRCGNEPVYLNPKDPYDLIKIKAIEAGGFSIIAKSYEDAKNMAKPVKFYLDKFVDTVSTKNKLTKLKNTALSILHRLYTTEHKRLFYIAKCLDANSVQYKTYTPIDIIYENMDSFISGDGAEKNKSRAAESFINVSELDMETLKIKAIVKDASYYKYIGTRGDGMIYDLESITILGRNVSEVVEYLKNPLNESILLSLMSKIEKSWNE